MLAGQLFYCVRNLAKFLLPDLLGFLDDGFGDVLEGYLGLVLDAEHLHDVLFTVE